MGTLSDLWNSLDFSAILSALMRLIAVFFMPDGPRDLPRPCGLCARRPDREAGASAEPEPAAPHRLGGPCVYAGARLRLGEARAGGYALFQKPKQGMALTALAGPVSNFVLALLALLCARLVYHQYGALWDFIFDLLLTTAYLSVGLGLFNLIPISRRSTAQRCSLSSCRTARMRS